jgi:hypothetical protein
MPMKCTIELAKTEKRIFNELSRNHHHRDIRIQGLGVLLLDEGSRVQDVARELEAGCKGVTIWICTAT